MSETQQPMFEPLRRVEVSPVEEPLETGGALIVMRLTPAEVDALGRSGPLIDEIRRLIPRPEED